MLYNLNFLCFPRCVHLSLRRPMYMHLSPLKPMYMHSKTVRQLHMVRPCFCGSNLLKPTCDYLCSLFSLTWSLDGVPSPPIQYLLQSQSFMIQSSEKKSFSTLYQCVKFQLSSSSPLSCFYNIELWPNPNIQSDWRLQLLLTSLEINNYYLIH